MKRYLLSFVGAVLVSGPAFAANPTPKTVEPTPVVAKVDWKWSKSKGVDLKLKDGTKLGLQRGEHNELLVVGKDHKSAVQDGIYEEVAGGEKFEVKAGVVVGDDKLAELQKFIAKHKTLKVHKEVAPKEVPVKPTK